MSPFRSVVSRGVIRSVLSFFYDQLQWCYSTRLPLFHFSFCTCYSITFVSHSIGHPMSSLAKSLRYSISRLDLNQQSAVCIIRLSVRVNLIVCVYFSKRKVWKFFVSVYFLSCLMVNVLSRKGIRPALKSSSFNPVWQACFNFVSAAEQEIDERENGGRRGRRSLGTCLSCRRSHSRAHRPFRFS